MTRFRWEQGGEATLEHLDGNFVTFLSTTASPPGRPLTALSDAGAGYQVKVRGCVRVELSPARYRIEGRLFNVTRDQRRELQQLLAQARAVGASSDNS